MRRIGGTHVWIVAVFFLFAGFLALPGAQGTEGRQASFSGQVTASDIQRVQEAVYDAGDDVRRVRSQDPNRADRLQAQLDDLRDEAIYLKVKQRKDGVSRTELDALRARIEDLRAETRRAQSAAGTDARPAVSGDRPVTTRPAAATERADDAPARQGTTTRPNEVPTGTELDVRLDTAVSSGHAQVEDRFTATTVADLYNGENLLIPVGSAVRGVVLAVTKAGRVERTGKLTLAFDRVTVEGRSYPMHATVVQALQSGGYRQDAGKIGAGAGIGAIIGGILGGFKGALAGILIGGGGVVAATEGQDVSLPPGTVLRIRLDSPVSMR